MHNMQHNSYACNQRHMHDATNASRIRYTLPEMAPTRSRIPKPTPRRQQSYRVPAAFVAAPESLIDIKRQRVMLLPRRNVSRALSRLPQLRLDEGRRRLSRCSLKQLPQARLNRARRLPPFPRIGLPSLKCPTQDTPLQPMPVCPSNLLLSTQPTPPSRAATTVQPDDSWRRLAARLEDLAGRQGEGLQDAQGEMMVTVDGREDECHSDSGFWLTPSSDRSQNSQESDSLYHLTPAYSSRSTPKTQQERLIDEQLDLNRLFFKDSVGAGYTAAVRCMNSLSGCEAIHRGADSTVSDLYVMPWSGL